MDGNFTYVNGDSVSKDKTTLKKLRKKQKVKSDILSQRATEKDINNQIMSLKDEKCPKAIKSSK